MASSSQPCRAGEMISCLECGICHLWLHGQGTSHDTPISDVVYNEPFNLVISCDESSTVRVWDAITGKAVYFFTEVCMPFHVEKVAKQNQ